MKIFFFGEDLNTSPPNVMTTHPESDTARENFLSFLDGRNTETFDGLPNSDWSEKFSFSSGEILYIDGWLTDELTDPGIYPISGAKYLRTTTVEGQFLGIEFFEPVAAFGFYGVDMGQNNGQFQLKLTDTTGLAHTYEIMNTVGSPNGSILYWAIIDTDKSIAKAEFNNAAHSPDACGFDDFTTATESQIRLPFKHHHREHQHREHHHKERAN